MKKTFTDEQIVGILRGFEASEKTIKEYVGKRMSAKAHFTNGVINLGRWRFPKFVSIANFNKKILV